MRTEPGRRRAYKSSRTRGNSGPFAATGPMPTGWCLNSEAGNSKETTKHTTPHPKEVALTKPNNIRKGFAAESQAPSAGIAMVYYVSPRHFWESRAWSRNLNLMGA